MPDDLYDQAVSDYVMGARAATASGLEGSPDEAARTYQLEQATGVPSQVIAPNLQQFDDTAQRALADHLVSQNPHLMAYVHSHPMAAGVSSDDWGAMDSFSRNAGPLAAGLHRLNQSWSRGLFTAAEEGFKEHFGTLPTFQPGPIATENLLKSAGLLGQIALQAGSGAIGAIAGGAGQLAANVLGEGARRDVQGMVEYELGGKPEVPLEAPGVHWTAAGREPPRYVNPAIDAAKAKVNAQMLDGIEASVAEAQNSATRERATDLFRNFAEQHYGDSTLSISSEAAQGLYGDRIPSPDDGLLGWVPGISDKLAESRETGGDIHIPIADWVSKVDPKVTQTLRDDIRMWPGGITARETLTPVGIPGMVDDALAEVRGTGGLEPMFSMGDRKLSLVPEGQAALPAMDEAGQMRDEEVHLYQIHDENGVPVGQMHLVPENGGKNLRVEWIGGNTVGQWANAFGPALVRDLLRQLKALYPEAETLGGYRVSGARYGRADTTSVRLDSPEGWSKIEGTRRIIQDAWRPINSNVEANIVPSEVYTAHEAELAGAIHDELAKITGGKAKVVPTAGIRYKGAAPRGVFFGRSNLILYDLLGDSPASTARHEAIHFLKSQGLFSDKEWATLKEAATQEGWVDRYNINQRYDQLYAGRPGLEEMKFEESIAEAFREWATQDAEARRQYSPVAQIFQKLWDFLQAIKGRMAEIFGHVPTADELFQKVASGEVGGRAMEGTGGSARGPMFSIDELDNLKASGLGLDLKTFQRIQKLVQERYASDVQASAKRAEREQARRQTKEWKDNKAEVSQEVETAILQRPDMAADRFIGSGEYFGEKLQQRFTLREADLTGEQRAALPAHYVSKNGIPVDEVAKLFGFQSGDAMVERLGALNALKGGRSPKEFLDHVVDVEANRVMEQRYGNLGQNILVDAQDQALAENDLNIVHEDYMAAAQQAGVTAVDKATIQARARELVDKMPLSEVSFEGRLQEIGKNYREAVRGLAAGDPASALVHLQRRSLNAHIAAEMKKVQKLQGQFNRTTKYYAKAWKAGAEQPVAADWNVFTRDMLGRIGVRYGMTVQGLQEAITRSRFDNLRDFVTKTEDENKISGLELPVPQWLMDATEPTSLDKLSVGQFRDVADAVRRFDKLGRADQKITRAGQAEAKAEWIGAARKQLSEKFDPLPSEKPVNPFHQAVATFTANETLMRRFDGRDPHGMFTETITYPAAEAANHKARLQRETTHQFRDLGPIKDADRTIEGPIIDPRTQKPRPLTRENLAVIISNMGNDYNWKILTKGWKVDPDVLWKWVEDNSTPEDLERALGLSKIYDGLWDKTQTLYENLYGRAPESVIPRPFTMHGRQWPGWYHPIVGDDQLSRFVNKMPDLDQPEVNYWPTTSNAYTRRRTGAVQVVSLDYKRALLRMDQMIHDIAYREFITNTAKILKDERFRDGIRTYYGKEYMEEMDTWLQRLAGESSYSTGAEAMASRFSNALRQNVVSTAIAFGATTVEKHGLTAFGMSAYQLDENLFKSIPKMIGSTAEVGFPKFAHSVAVLFGRSDYLGNNLWDFAIRASEELQRRERNFLDTMKGQQAIFEGRMKLRDRISQWGAKAVAFSDLLSAVPLWVAKYHDELAANGGVHGDAVRVADAAVRLAHGSTAVTNLPRIAANQGPITPWLTSLYGFMGTSMQRRIEIFHDINDAYKLGRQGQIRDAAKGIPKILSATAVHVLWVGLVEEAVAGQFTQDKRGPGLKALEFAFGTVAQTVIGLRDLAYDLQHGQESVGLISTPIHDLRNFLRDADKRDPLGKAHAGKLVEDGCATLGDLAGLCPHPLGRAAHYGLDVFDGFQHPRDLGDVYHGVVSGRQQPRVVR